MGWLEIRGGIHVLIIPLYKAFVKIKELSPNLTFYLPESRTLSPFLDGLAPGPLSKR